MLLEDAVDVFLDEFVVDLEYAEEFDALRNPANVVARTDPLIGLEFGAAGGFMALMAPARATSVVLS